MLAFLAIIFIILCLSIGGQRTAKSLISLTLNGISLLFCIFLIIKGIPPLLACLSSCVAISFITLYYQNGRNKKTVAAMYSVVCIVSLMSVFVYFFISFSDLQGFPSAQFDIQEANGYLANIAINMQSLQSCVVLTILIGTVIDTAIAISSALYEIHLHKKNLSKKELFFSGMNIGKNILSSTVNTLFFIYIAEYLTLFLQFASDYTLPDMLNSKEFCQESASVILACIASILVIPVSSAVSVQIFKTTKNPS